MTGQRPDCRSCPNPSKSAMAVQRIGFFLVPGFSIADLSSAIEPLLVVNRIRRKQLYNWQLISVNDQPVASDSGFILMPHGSIDQAGDFSLLLIVSSLVAAGYCNSRVNSWLRRLARTDCRLGAVDCGTILLARAGLLDGYHCALPWQLEEDFAEQFPEVVVTRDLFSIDRGRLTCAGETAVLDLMLALITEQQGPDTAVEVADHMLYTRIRAPGESQRMAIEWRYGITDSRMVKAITLMEQHIEHPRSMHAIAHTVGISLRQLDRLFVKQLHHSPSRFYLGLRLKHAQMLLMQSTDSILGIALRCGFCDASHLGKCYRKIFHETPAQVRRSKYVILQKLVPHSQPPVSDVTGGPSQFDLSIPEIDHSKPSIVEKERLSYFVRQGRGANPHT